MRALEFIARTLFLILSGLATFAILASVQTAFHNVGRERAMDGMGAGQSSAAMGGEPLASDSALPSPGASAAPSTPDHVAPGGARMAPKAVAREAEPLREIARWIEALTYAVLALAGFVAAGVVVLLRIAFGPARRD